MITRNETKEDLSAAVEETVRVRGDEALEYVLYRDEEDGREVYSIQAIQYRRGKKICQATARDVSSIQERAREMFSLIADGLIEPYVLCDVVYDLLP